MYVRTRSFTFTRRTPRVNVKLGTPHIELHVRTSTMCTCARTWSFTFAFQVRTWNSTFPRAHAARRHGWRASVDMVDVRTWSSTCERETPRGTFPRGVSRAKVEFDVRTWTGVGLIFEFYMRTWNSTWACRHGSCAHVEFHVRMWSLKKKLAGWLLRATVCGSPVIAWK